MRQRRSCLIFQSTLPSRGATYPSASAASDAEFQSTLPSRGATDALNKLRESTYISIHAPLAGSDVVPQGQFVHRPLFQSTLPSRGATDALLNNLLKCSFQSTLPSRGATNMSPGRVITASISIHAPLAGSDINLA